ncbi:MAG TPA: subtype A tannase [Methanocella sp.]|nr:subtype A tannase [Methanocella sp.]
MKSIKIVLSLLLVLVIAVCVEGCSSSPTTLPSANATATPINGGQQVSSNLTINNSAWHYDAINNVFWQIGVGYCSKPETAAYENMGVYVPGQYFNAIANGDGTYTCTINATGQVSGYTAHTAPIVIPVNTPGYSAQTPPASYSFNDVSDYIKAGFVYLYPGLRGRDNGYDSSGKLIYSGGAPWGVTDLKAAVRYYRYNQNVLPGDTDRIFTFGMSGGGAQSAVMGASGDSKLYYPYLNSIGAATNYTNGTIISDAISGVMSWCPITSLDYADEAYEWNMGQYSSSDTRANTTWTSALSADLANTYGDYINKLHLKDSNGTVLTLENSSVGIYTSGTYYEYILSVIEGSLDNFLHDTTFPYTESSGNSMAAGGSPPTGSAPNGGIPSGSAPGGNISGGNAPGGNMNQSQQTSSITYNTTQEYIDSLNSDGEWVKYDPVTNTVQVTSIEAFVKHFKNPSKSVPAFDDLNRSQAENNLFGNNTNDSLHFDATAAGLLQKNKDNYSAYNNWNSSLVNVYATDLTAVDKLGNNIQYRQNMYNPMYYLSDYYEGYNTSIPATHWRIRTGIEQGDTALTVETNLALALKQYHGVEDVDFETVWGQGHTMAERTGTSTDNFIVWVNNCTETG